jgi:hypothetical protein
VPAGSEEAVEALALRDSVQTNLHPIDVPHDIKPTLSLPYYTDLYDFARRHTEIVFEDRSAKVPMQV